MAALVIERANQQLANDDATISIILGAMAVESQMAYLFFKWRAIDSGKSPFDPTEEDKDKWEQEWDEMRSMGNRLEQLSCHLSSVNFDKFAEQNKTWLLPALRKFVGGTSVKKFFQEQLFEKRNRIVHFGNLDFQKAQAQECLDSTVALISLLDAMDKVRIKQMDVAHKKQQNCSLRAP